MWLTFEIGEDRGGSPFQRANRKGGISLLDCAARPGDICPGDEICAVQLEQNAGNKLREGANWSVF